jgi:hypothetical protein
VFFREPLGKMVRLVPDVFLVTGFMANGFPTSCHPGRISDPGSMGYFGFYESQLGPPLAKALEAEVTDDEYP